MALNITWLWITAVAALGSWCVHTFVGGPRILPALAQSSLAPMPRNVLYFVWHIATILLLAFPLTYALAALYPWAAPLAVESTVLCALIAALIGFVAIRRRMAFMDMPQWTLFLTVAVLGTLAVLL